TGHQQIQLSSVIDIVRFSRDPLGAVAMLGMEMRDRQDKRAVLGNLLCRGQGRCPIYWPDAAIDHQNRIASFNYPDIRDKWNAAVFDDMDARHQRTGCRGTDGRSVGWKRGKGGHGIPSRKMQRCALSLSI